MREHDAQRVIGYCGAKVKTAQRNSGKIPGEALSRSQRFGRQDLGGDGVSRGLCTGVD